MREGWDRTAYAVIGEPHVRVLPCADLVGGAGDVAVVGVAARRLALDVAHAAAAVGEAAGACVVRVWGIVQNPA